MLSPKYPTLYQINTRVWLKENWGPNATLGDIPDEELDKIKEFGFDWIYLLSVWQTGEAGREMSRTNPQWVQSYKEQLPDLKQEDICGSGFAINSYTLDTSLGKPADLVNFRDKLHERGMKLMLDFVPNHAALDHPWILKHPGYFIKGTEADLEKTPENFTRIQTAKGQQVFAYGRDPYFSGWVDTLQLNYGNPKLHEAMFSELVNVAELCDGLRVDMAMLVTPEVFKKTWGIEIQPFWPGAIESIKNMNPDFCFLGEVYWDMEWEMQQQGFDYTYDKRLYDRLLEMEATPVRQHLKAEMDFQDRLCRFLENHDEERIASVLDPMIHKAAAMITFLSPGMRFFHQGQIQGWKNRLSVHLCRRNFEAGDDKLGNFYKQLLTMLTSQIFKTGDWKLLEVADETGNVIPEPPVIACEWKFSEKWALVAVNYSKEPFKGSIVTNNKYSSVHFDTVRSDSHDNHYGGLKISDGSLIAELGPWDFEMLIDSD